MIGGADAGNSGARTPGKKQKENLGMAGGGTYRETPEQELKKG